MRNVFEQRKFVMMAVIILTGLAFAIRLFSLQVLDSEYKLSAENNVLRYVTQYPPRGLIYDRNGELLVFNEAAYDLLVVPNQLAEFDTLELTRLLEVDIEGFNERLEKAQKYSYYKPSVFLEQISREGYGFLEEMLYKYPGFYVQSRTLRKYSYPLAAHILGYVGEVNQKEIERSPYYKSGDYIGKSGIEKAYEDVLRGQKGLNIILVDVFNREKGSFQDGRHDTSAVAGKNLYLTIDAGLQQYGEKLMENKKGSIVALDPQTGEILSMVSSPSYDPNMLVGRIRSKNFRILSKDSLKPLFNRATMAQYPPGSTFKMVNALIALQDEVLFPYTHYSCKGLQSYPIPCSHDHESPLDLGSAIEQSCNPYFWKVYKSILEEEQYKDIQSSYENWRSKVATFGIGQLLETDLLEQSDGNLPHDSYFNKYYGVKGWKATTVRSLSIGQGEIELTPLQLANLASILANKGYYLPPHILKDIAGSENVNPEFNMKHEVPFSKKYFDIAVEGMERIYTGEYGSARWYRIDSISMCGKTGTSQNPHGKNHSIFIAFAPKENPKIAISVVVENSGFGSTWAAPIATLMMEKYLTGSVEPKWWIDKILNTNLITAN